MRQDTEVFARRQPARKCAQAEESPFGVSAVKLGSASPRTRDSQSPGEWRLRTPLGAIVQELITGGRRGCARRARGTDDKRICLFPSGRRRTTR